MINPAQYKFKKAVLSLAAAALSLGMAASAQAGSLVSLTLTGTITGTSGPDTLNLYGGGDLTGQTATTTITYDATALLYGATHGGDYHNTASQLTWNDLSQHVMTSTTVINGHTFTVGSGDQGYLLACSECGGNDAFIVQNGTGSRYNQLHVFPSGNGGIITDFSSGAAIATWINSYGNGAAILSQSGTQEFVFLGSVTATGSTTETTPEPGTWALLSLGIGAVAFVKRRRTV